MGRVNAKARSNYSAVNKQFKMWLGEARYLAVMAIAATAILHSVAAMDNYNENWGGDSQGKDPDNRFVVGNWKQRNEGRRDIKIPLALFRKRSNMPAVKIAEENLTEPGGKRANGE